MFFGSCADFDADWDAGEVEAFSEEIFDVAEVGFGDCFFAVLFDEDMEGRGVYMCLDEAAHVWSCLTLSFGWFVFGDGLFDESCCFCG